MDHPGGMIACVPEQRRGAQGWAIQFIPSRVAGPLRSSNTASASEHTMARELWIDVINGIGKLSSSTITQYRAFNFLINRAYGLAKLERFSEVASPAREGRKGIELGKGTFKAPHRNSREFALAPLLIRLAEFRLGKEGVMKVDVQQSLVTYKDENARYGRLGYPVIFDLQISYPDIFDPVLPGSDPEKD